MMKILTTILKYLTSIVLAIGLLVWGIFSAKFFIKVFGKDKVLPSEIGARAEYAKFGDLYNHLLFIGIALGAGLSLSLLFWDKKERQNKAYWIYLLFLLILVPLSIINYISGDWFFDRWKQAFVDILICILGLFVLMRLLKVQTKSTESSILKAIAIFFVSSQAILIPGIYFILWFFNFQNAISLANTKNFSPNWITYITAIGGLVISTLNYRLSLRKEKSGN